MCLQDKIKNKEDFISDVNKLLLFVLGYYTILFFDTLVSNLNIIPW